MQTCKLLLTGRLPMLMHNEQMANPMAPASKKLKEITNKRKKTDDDMMAIAFAEFEGGLYFDDSIGPYVPQHWILAMLREAGKKTKQGKDVVSSIIAHEDRLPIQYEGPRKVSAMWKAGMYDQRMVGNQSRRILRTRPKFEQWEVQCTLSFDETVFDPNHIKSIAETGGSLIGLGDYRPRFGRFNVRVEQ